MQSVLLGTATWDLKQDLQFLNLSTKTILDLSKNVICMSVVIFMFERTKLQYRGQHL